MLDTEKLERPATKHIGIGFGLAGLRELYFAQEEAEEQGERVRATIYEQNAEFGETIAVNVCPSLTIDELIAVLPANKMFIDGLKEKFDLPLVVCALTMYPEGWTALHVHKRS